MSHQKQDRFGLAFARRIADGLGEHPEWIALAKSNVERWSRLNAGSPSLLRCYEEWRVILQGTSEEVVAALLDPSGRGQVLRQNSPFAGAISAKEVWRMKREADETVGA